MTTQRSQRPHPDREVQDERHAWWLELDEDGVTARDASRLLAHADVREDGDRVQLMYWLDDGLPGEVGIGLTRGVFALPAMQPHRPVVVSVPHREVDVLAELSRHLVGAITHVAGSTCLVVGRVR